MTYLTIHKMTGNPDELSERKRAHMDPTVNQVAPTQGAIFSVTARTEDGLVVVNLWESREAAEVFTQRPDIQQAQRASGLPMPSSFERYEDADYQDYRQGRG